MTATAHPESHAVPAPPAAMPGAPTNLKPYVLGLLRDGPATGTLPADEARALTARHLAFVREQIEAKRFVFASPLLDDGSIAGLVYVRAASTGEALEVMLRDPAVVAGRFVVEVHPAWAPDLDGVVVRY
jgi:uncharacterized protein YciI